MEQDSTIAMCYPKMPRFSSLREFWESFRNHPFIKAIIVVEGSNVMIDTTLPIEKGDTYLAERNTGTKLLTCQEHNHETGVVFPVEMAYAFDTWECKRVISIDGEPI